MAKAYYEQRISAARGTDSLAADIMRHLHTRQHLGKAVVICDQPIVMLSAARKQWLKLSRIIQRQRASTLNGDKVLKYTHTITRMQHMQFTMYDPLSEPDADVYFMTPEQIDSLPTQCLSLYDTVLLTKDQVESALAQLAYEALVIDYDHHAPWPVHELISKTELEEQVVIEWRRMLAFLESHGIAISKLRASDVESFERMDETLDTLLAVSNSFLEVATAFHHALELARPLRLNKSLREEYDAVALLAHRVQALSPNPFSQRFLEVYNEDDTLFLYDSAKEDFVYEDETLAMAVKRHEADGHHRLAAAIRTYKPTRHSGWASLLPRLR